MEVNDQSTRHIDKCHHTVRQQIANKIMDLEHVPSKVNIADMLTKALGLDISTRCASS